METNVLVRDIDKVAKTGLDTDWSVFLGHMDGAWITLTGTVKVVHITPSQNTNCCMDYGYHR